MIGIGQPRLGFGNAVAVEERRKIAIAHALVDQRAQAVFGHAQLCRQIADGQAWLLPCARRHRGDQPVLGVRFRPRAHILTRHLPQHRQRRVHQIPDDAFDVAADIADLSEFRRLDLQKRRLRQPGQPPRDLSFAAAGRADHKDVLWHDLFPHPLRKVLTPPAIAQRDRDRALGVMLTDDEPVQLGDDFPGRIGGHLHQIDSTMTLPLV